MDNNIDRMIAQSRHSYNNLFDSHSLLPVSSNERHRCQVQCYVMRRHRNRTLLVHACAMHALATMAMARWFVASPRRLRVSPSPMPPSHLWSLTKLQFLIWTSERVWQHSHTFIHKRELPSRCAVRIGFGILRARHGSFDKATPISALSIQLVKSASDKSQDSQSPGPGESWRLPILALHTTRRATSVSKQSRSLLGVCLVLMTS